MKIKEYITVCENDLHYFDQKVNENLKNGFCLFGKRFVSENLYCHEMVKYEEEKNNDHVNRSLVDFDVSLHRTEELRKGYLERRKNEGWELFKEDFFECNDLMSFKLMMVKYE